MEVQEHIEKVRDALGKATPGPWQFKVKRIEKGEDGEFAVGNLENKNELILDVFKNKHGIPTIFSWNESNADLIANSPTWLQTSIDLLEQQQREIERLRGGITRMREEIFDWYIPPLAMQKIGRMEKELLKEVSTDVQDDR